MSKNKEVSFLVGDMVFATSATEYHSGYITEVCGDDWGNTFVLIDNKIWVNPEEYKLQTFNLERDKDKLFPLMSF